MTNNQPPKQPREFWVRPGTNRHSDQDIIWTEKPPTQEERFTHVIEKSYAEALERELKENFQRHVKVIAEQTEKITELQAQLCREQKQSREGAKEMGDKISALKAQLEEANKYKTGWENQIKFIEEKKKRIAELEAALENALELTYVPEHAQDDEWYAKQKEAEKALNKGEW